MIKIWQVDVSALCDVRGRQVSVSESVYFSLSLYWIATRFNGRNSLEFSFFSIGLLKNKSIIIPLYTEF